MGEHRDEIQGDIILGQENEGSWITRRFTVHSCFNSGNSVLCYEASYGQNSKGVLKEFYPSSITTGRRLRNNQLDVSSFIHSSEADYTALRKEYLNSYQLLLEARRKDRNGDLSTFIPNFEIYQGWDTVSGYPLSTSYIWTPENKLVTCSDVIRRCHNDPDMDPGEVVLLMVRIVRTLTRCVCALHQERLLHRDIKPQNFGFITRSNEVLVDTLSMFDIDTICPISSKPKKAMGTIGYMDMEQLKLGLSLQSDIYSIGATLYAALVFPRDEHGRMLGFRDTETDEIEQKLMSCELIQRCSPQIQALVPRLAAVMAKCLCPRAHRYQCCEDLDDDLRPLLRVLYAAASQDELVKTRADAGISSAAEECTPELDQVLCTHLYQHPLFECIVSGSGIMRVVIVGLDLRAEHFLDLCLQMGQIRDISLKIRVLCPSKEQAEHYLKARPALSRMITLNGAPARESDLAALDFVSLPAASDSNFLNAAMSTTLFPNQTAPDYVFFCLPDSRKNLTAASRFKRWMDRSHLSVSVSYAWKEADGKIPETEGIWPVVTDRDLKEDPFWNDLDRMGLNTHLIWKNDLNLDNKDLIEEYMDPYNHRSSICCALYQMYKLFSLDIDLRSRSTEEAADQYACLVEVDPDDLDDEEAVQEVKTTVEQLSDLEHRRWLMEKACDGWQPFEDPSVCPLDTTRDEVQKRHLTMVSSRPGFGLDNEELWNSCTPEQYESLDDLDRISLDRHRRFVQEAEKVRSTDLMHGSLVRGIREMLRDNRIALNAFNEWQNAAADLWAGKKDRLEVYRWQKKAFLSALKEYSGEERVLISDQADMFDHRFSSIIAELQHRDFKKSDLDLVKNTPFILTYDRRTTLILPLQTGSNTRYFSNASSAAAVNPKKIVYLLLVQDSREARECIMALQIVKSFFKRKNLHPLIELFIATGDLAEPERKFFRDELQYLDPSLVSSAQWVSVTDSAQFDLTLRDRIQKEKENSVRFGLEKNRSPLAARMEGADLFPLSSTYLYDLKNQAFKSVFYRNTFSYIPYRPHVTIEDLVQITSSKYAQESFMDIFGDYQTLWNRLMKTPYLWRNFCSWMRRETLKEELLVSFPAAEGSSQLESTEECSWTLPGACYDGITEILEDLISYGIVSESSGVSVSSLYLCQVQIETQKHYRKGLDQLFSNVYPLMVKGALRPQLCPDGPRLDIYFSQLLVGKISLPADREEAAACEDFLHFMEERGYIINLQIEDRQVSFAFASGNIRELMTDPCIIQEIYIGQKMRESGLFDDIASHIRIQWPGSGFETCLCCAGTSGYRSVFVACASDAVLRQEDYYNLAVAVSRFGINTVPVMADFFLSSSSIATEHAERICEESRKHMGIVTLTDQKSLENPRRYFESLLSSEFSEISF